MIFVLFGIAAGLLLGILLPWSVPSAWSPYLSVAALAAFSAVIEGAVARQRGSFRSGLLLAGFLGDAALAGVLAWVGDRLDIPLYLAAVVYFGGKIFMELGKLREIWADNHQKNGQKAEDEGENQRI